MEEITFGKYEGEYVDAVAKKDVGYLRWLMEQDWLEGRFPDLHACIEDTLKETN